MRHLIRTATSTLTSILALGLLPIACRSADESSARPNVVLILADDLGGKDLGCYGSTFHRTPHLDRLAAGGVRFDFAYSACPVCSPTRAALMTGRWPARLHLTDWLPGRGDLPSHKLKRPAFRQELPLEEQTLAEILRAAGYATASIGKWHLGGVGFEPTKQGFDLNVAGDHTGTPLSYFAPYRRSVKGADVYMPGLENAPEGEYLTDRLTAEAVKFIEANRSRPFFLYVPHNAVHTPLKAKAELVAKYPAATTFRGAQNNPIYAAMLESLDEGVGRILKALDDLKLSERTIVVFTSDNGGLSVMEGMNTPATSNAPLREGKGFLYEGGIRVPLLVRGPGVRAGAVSSLPACSVDILPTLLELCGVTRQPSDVGELARLDGVSLAAELKGTGKVDRDALYWHYPHYANQGSRPGGAVREGEYKLIESYESGRRELFHVVKDVGESQNLVEREPQLAERMAAKLASWRESVGAQMPSPNPAYLPNPQAQDGKIVMPARTADVHGVMLRYEPMPHKFTLGYWVKAEDWASFEYTVTKPGEFELTALVGCGNGSGGSEVHFETAGQTLTLKVEETGGFQNFVPRVLGTLKFDKPGRYALTVKPVKKPGVAVMDLREVVLSPVRSEGARE